MKALKLTAITLLVLFALPVASVFGSGDYPIAAPLIGTTTGSPALASPSLYSSILTVHYPDGKPAVLNSGTVTLELCAASCTTVTASLKQTAPGTYAYTFTPPATLTGSITIFVQAGSLADENGRIFPSADTQIGTYASSGKAPVSSPSDQIPSSSSSPGPTQSAPAVSPESLKETKVAVSTTQPTQQSPLLEVLLSLALLGAAAFGLLFFPRRI
ncbi:MAG: hypothetical protein ABSF00_07635 [Candidatus Bathyarchaeia archaeon]|jgi:hypothetical protein